MKKIKLKKTAKKSKTKIIKKAKIKNEFNENIQRAVDKLNERKDTDGFIFSSLDFHLIDDGLMLSNANNMIQQRNQFLELAEKNNNAQIQGTNDAIAGAACKALTVLNKIYLKNTEHRLFASHLRDGEAKIWLLKEYSVLLKSLTKSLSIISERGRVLKKPNIEAATNFFKLLLSFKEISEEFDKSIALFGEAVIDIKMNLIKKDIEKNKA